MLPSVSPSEFFETHLYEPKSLACKFLICSRESSLYMEWNWSSALCVNELRTILLLKIQYAIAFGLESVWHSSVTLEPIGAPTSWFGIQIIGSTENENKQPNFSNISLVLDIYIHRTFFSIQNVTMDKITYISIQLI